MRTYYWYVTAYLRKHGLVLLGSIITAVLIFSLIIPTALLTLDQTPRHYVGLVGDYRLETLPPSVLNKISRGLTMVQPDGSAAPDLAERWTVEDDGKTYRFLFRKELYWQDGVEVKPSDLSYPFSDVETIATPTEVVFKLPDSYVPFPNVVSQPIVQTRTVRYLGFLSRPMLIGLGEYRMIDYKQRGQKITQLTLESKKDRLIYRFYPTEADALVAFKQGEVDELPDFSSTYDVADWSNVKVNTTVHNNRYAAVFFNNSSPMFPKNVRQALAYAIEKPDKAIRALGPISRDSWAYLEGGKSYEYDIDRALERILDDIPDQPLEFELITTSTFQQEAESIRQAWQTFGDQAVAACQTKKEVTDKATCQNLKITPSVRINNYPDTSSFQVLLVGQETPSDPDQYYLWHSGQPSNFIQYKNTRIDSLLEKGRTITDPIERKAIYQEFQQFFLEDAPVIFLRYLESYDITRT